MPKGKARKLSKEDSISARRVRVDAMIGRVKDLKIKKGKGADSYPLLDLAERLLSEVIRIGESRGGEHDQKFSEDGGASICIDHVDGVEVERVTFKITKAEEEAFNQLPHDSILTTVMFDQESQAWFAVSRDDCRSGCRCAAQAWIL